MEKEKIIKKIINRYKKIHNLIGNEFWEFIQMCSSILEAIPFPRIQEEAINLKDAIMKEGFDIRDFEYVNLQYDNNRDIENNINPDNEIVIFGGNKIEYIQNKNNIDIKIIHFPDKYNNIYLSFFSSMYPIFMKTKCFPYTNHKNYFPIQFTLKINYKKFDEENIKKVINKYTIIIAGLYDIKNNKKYFYINNADKAVKKLIQDKLKCYKNIIWDYNIISYIQYIEEGVHPYIFEKIIDKEFFKRIPKDYKEYKQIRKFLIDNERNIEKAIEKYGESKITKYKAIEGKIINEIFKRGNILDKANAISKRLYSNINKHIKKFKLKGE